MHYIDKSRCWAASGAKNRPSLNSRTQEGHIWHLFSLVIARRKSFFRHCLVLPALRYQALNPIWTLRLAERNTMRSLTMFQMMHRSLCCSNFCHPMMMQTPPQNLRPSLSSPPPISRWIEEYRYPLGTARSLAGKSQRGRKPACGLEHGRAYFSLRAVGL